MFNWQAEPTDRFTRRRERFEKKNFNELLAMENNLDTYFRALRKTNNPMVITAKFVHPEPGGIKALDQSGTKNKELSPQKKKLKLKQTRLYIFPHVGTKTLHLLTIGDKQSQQADIKYCRNIVKNIKRSYDEEAI